MNMPTRRLFSLAAAAVVVLMFAWYLAIYRPSSARINAAHKAYNAAAAQISKLDAQVGSLQALEARIPADKAQLASLDNALPTTPNLRVLLDQLHGLATSTGTQLTTVSPSAPQPATTGQASAAPSAAPGAVASGLQKITIVMSATGTYAQLTNFLSGLAALQRSLVVESVSITSAPAGQLIASLSTEVFYAP